MESQIGGTSADNLPKTAPGTNPQGLAGRMTNGESPGTCIADEELK